MLFIDANIDLLLFEFMFGMRRVPCSSSFSLVSTQTIHISIWFFFVSLPFLIGKKRSFHFIWTGKNHVGIGKHGNGKSFSNNNSKGMRCFCWQQYQIDSFVEIIYCGFKAKEFNEYPKIVPEFESQIARNSAPAPAPV